MFACLRLDCVSKAFTHDKDVLLIKHIHIQGHQVLCDVGSPAVEDLST